MNNMGSSPKSLNFTANEVVLCTVDVYVWRGMSLGHRELVILVWVINLIQLTLNRWGYRWLASALDALKLAILCRVFVGAWLSYFDPWLGFQYDQYCRVLAPVFISSFTGVRTMVDLLRHGRILVYRWCTVWALIGVCALVWYETGAGCRLVPESGDLGDDECSVSEKMYVRSKREREHDLKVLLPLTGREVKDLNGRYGRMRESAREHCRMCWRMKSFLRSDPVEALMERLQVSDRKYKMAFENRLFIVPEAGDGLSEVMSVFDAFANREGWSEMADMFRHLLFLVYVRDQPLLVADRLFSITQTYERYVNSDGFTPSLRSALAGFEASDKSLGLKPQIGWIDDVRRIFDLKDAPMMTEFLSLFRRFMGSAYRCVFPETMDMVFTEALKAFETPDSIGSLAISGATFFLSLGEMLVQVISGASVWDVIRTSRAERWRAKVESTLAKPRLGKSEEWPLKNTWEVKKFLTELNALYHEGLALQLAKSNPLIYDVVKSLGSQIQALEFALNPVRVVPVSYLLIGPPGTGKTTIFNEFHDIVKEFVGVDPSISVSCSYKMEVKFQGWVITDPKMVTFNDAFSTKEGLTPGVPSMLSVIQEATDSDPWHVPEAEADKKKYGLRRPKLTVLSSNVSSFDFATQTAPEKLIRRLEVISTKYTGEAIDESVRSGIPLDKLLEVCHPNETDGYVEYTFRSIKKEGATVLNFNGPVLSEKGNPLVFTSRLLFFRFLRKRVLRQMAEKEAKFQSIRVQARCSNRMPLPHDLGVCGCASPTPEVGIRDIARETSWYCSNLKLTKKTCLLLGFIVAQVFLLLGAQATIWLAMICCASLVRSEMIAPPPVEEVEPEFWNGAREKMRECKSYLVVKAIGLLKHKRVNDFVVSALPWTQVSKDKKLAAAALVSLGTLVLLAKAIRLVLSPEGGFIGTLRMKKDLPQNYVPVLGKPPSYFGGAVIDAVVSGEDPYGENRVELSRGKQFIMGTRLSQNVILFPYHFLNMKECYPDHSERCPTVLDGELITIKYQGHTLVTKYNKDFVFRGEGDVCFMFVSGFTFPCVDLRGFFPVGLLPETAICSFKEHTVSVTKSQMVAYKTRMTVYTSVGVETASGDCGRLVVTLEGGILAMHMAANVSILGRQAVACVVARSDVDKAFEKFKSMGFGMDPWVGDNLVPEGAKLRPGVHPKSDAGWMIQDGFKFGAIILGHLPTNSKSVFRGDKTSLHEFFGSEIPDYVLPEKFHAHENSNGKWVGPYVNKYREMISSPPGYIDLGLGCRAVDLFLTGFLKPSADTHPLSITQALGGVPGDQFALRRPQKSLGEACRQAGITNDNLINSADGVIGDVNPLYETMIHEILETNSGSVGTTFNKLTLKEEWVKSTKWQEDGKVRLFALEDSAYNIVLKSHMVPLMGQAMKQSAWSGVCGLVNAGSNDWRVLYKHLGGDVRTKVMESDQKGYDSHHRVMIEVYCRFVYKFALGLGYTEIEARLTQNLALAGFNQISCIEGNYFQYSYMLASGRADTLFANSIIHALIYMMAFIQWHELRNLPVPIDYQEFLKFAFVGDDTLAQASNMPGFDSLYIQEFAGSLGYVVTSARKDEALEAEVPFEVATFLKRSFRVEGSRIFAPLAVESILKSLCYRLKSEASDEEHESSVVEGAQREYFLHGEEAFAAFQQRMDDTGRPYKRLSYSDLLEEFDANEFTTWATASAVLEL